MIINKQKFALYDVVEINSQKSSLKKINGKKGIIRGISENEDNPPRYAYAVDLPSIKTNWFICEEDLKATGKKVSPEQVTTDTFVMINKKGEPSESC